MKSQVKIIIFLALLLGAFSSTSDAQSLLDQTSFAPVQMPYMRNVGTIDLGGGCRFVGSEQITGNQRTAYYGIFYSNEGWWIQGWFNTSFQPNGYGTLVTSDGTAYNVQYNQGSLISKTQQQPTTPTYGVGGNYNSGYSSGSSGSSSSSSQATCRGCNGSGNCQHCHGKGYISSGSSCSLCHGNGRCVSCGGRGWIRL